MGVITQVTFTGKNGVKNENAQRDKYRGIDTFNDPGGSHDSLLHYVLIEDTMDIYSSEGSKVMFKHESNGYKSHQETARKYLKLGAVYTVRSTVIGGSHTDVYLNEVPNVAFNSVMFENT